VLTPPTCTTFARIRHWHLEAVGFTPVAVRDIVGATNRVIDAGTETDLQAGHSNALYNSTFQHSLCNSLTTLAYCRPDCTLTACHMPGKDHVPQIIRSSHPSSPESLTIHSAPMSCSTALAVSPHLVVPAHTLWGQQPGSLQHN